MLESQRKLYALLNVTPNAVIPLEIGGGNGLQGLIIGASKNMDIPAVDADWMGRAASSIPLLSLDGIVFADDVLQYPVSWQTTPVVYEKKATMIPTCISDGNGRIIVNPQPIESSRSTS
jgi:DUF917 family protein